MPRSAIKPPAVGDALAHFAAELRRRFGPAVIEVKLFGSFARGEAWEESDVDVAVVLERVDWALQREVIDLATDLGLDRGLLISPTLLDRGTYRRWRVEERPLVMDIERDGVAL